MKRTLQQHWRILVLAVCLALFIAAEKLAWLRTDSLAAIACTQELLRPRPDPAALLRQHRQTIAAESRHRDLPPELLATIIYSHQAALTSFRRFTDCAGSALGQDLSLGLGQIRVSTAARNDDVLTGKGSTARFREYRSALLDPARHIGYLAKEVRLLLDRNNRSPGITAEQLIREPHAMALLLSEYRVGRQAAASDVARVGASGIGDLGYLERNEVYLFGRDVMAVREIQAGVGRHLDSLYCTKGRLHDARICAERRARAASAR